MSESRSSEQRHELNIEIGKRCKKARIDAKITQEKLAELLDVNSQFISDMERGRVGLSLLSLKSLSDILGVTTDYLIKGITNEATKSQLILGDRTINLSSAEYEIMTQNITTILQAFSLHESIKE